MGGRGSASWYRYSQVSGGRSSLRIRRGIGGAFYLREVKDVDGTVKEMAVDSRLTDIEVIAGAGHRRKIDDIAWLIDKYGGSRDEWTKVKGRGKVKVNGIELDVEIHWYELEDIPFPFEEKIVKYIL